MILMKVELLRRCVLVVLGACSLVDAQIACLPVATMTVPIQVWVDGQGNLCPSQKGASNDLTRFVEAEIVEQYRHIMNCSTCRLSGVELTLCSSRPTGPRAYTLLTYTANMTCSNGCHRAQPRHRDTLQANRQQLAILWSAVRDKPQVKVEYVPGYTVTLSYFQGRKGGVMMSCDNTDVAYNIRDKLAVCTCSTACLDVCELPHDPGPCPATTLRYFYNQTSSACESFSFGGCQGNSNNFVTLEACQQRCSN